jgi:hypothetical protein
MRVVWSHFVILALSDLHASPSQDEMSENQDFITREGAIAPCISAMHSRHIEVRCESGRLLSNLAACGNKLSVDVVIDAGGERFADIVSLFPGHLLSMSFRIGNLCTPNHHQRKLIGVLELLQSLMPLCWPLPILHPVLANMSYQILSMQK